MVVFWQKRILEIQMPVVRKIEDRGHGGLMPLRVTEGKGRAKKGGVRIPRLLIRCGFGCCDSRLEINYDDDPTRDLHTDTLEINGVFGTIDQWRQLLLPLLQLDVPGPKQTE
ncbi:MAG: hypothetical protein AAB901_00105 [Patescibacteria group bacterium]